MPVFTVEEKLRTHQSWQRCWFRRGWAGQSELSGLKETGAKNRALQTEREFIAASLDRRKLMSSFSIKTCKPILAVTKDTIMNLKISITCLLWPKSNISIHFMTYVLETPQCWSTDVCPHNASNTCPRIHTTGMWPSHSPELMLCNYSIRFRVYNVGEILQLSAAFQLLETAPVSGGREHSVQLLTR